ncbi:MAG TPA: triacylglycerol lipase [Pseudomonadota bacterium]|nr:triacylglycerol lipase [Pseudomonadota bacterium]
MRRSKFPKVLKISKVPAVKALADGNRISVAARVLCAGTLGLLVGSTGCGEGVDLAVDEAQVASVAAPLTTACKGAPYPVLLAHGMAGFDRIGPINYFFNVAADLRARGETVIESQVAPFESSAVRGAQLAHAIDDALAATRACKINVIAHSQGGLDARYAISSLRYGDRIASLVTVSTPHQGTVIADAALGLVPGFSYDVINAILRAIYGSGHSTSEPSLKASLTQLTRDNMQRRFNSANRDDARVKYYSIAGRSSARLASSECAGGLWSNGLRVDLLDPLLVLPETVFVATSPNPLWPVPNDGLVSVESAKWGTFLGCVPADHFDEIGQLAHLIPDIVSGYDHKAMYRKVVDKLHRDGL